MTEAESKLDAAIALVETIFPNAVQVLSKMDIRLDERVGTAAVTASGRMLVAPSFAEKLSLRHLTFVVAHELYHVLYGVFDRFPPGHSAERDWLVNIAHDFIINDMLRRKFKAETHLYDTYDEWTGEPIEVGGESYVPDCGLFWDDYRSDYRRETGEPQPPITAYSLESLVLELERIRRVVPRRNLLVNMRRVGGARESGPGDAEDPSPFDALQAKDFPLSNEDSEHGADEDRDRGSRLADLLGGNPIPELVSAEIEAGLFPDETAVERDRRREEVKRAGELMDAREIMRNQLGTMGGRLTGDGDYMIRALSGSYQTPWEGLLQKWLDENTNPVRSWAKASRRAGDRADVCLPGRQREGRIIHIVADTSGSMGRLLPAMLGMIQAFGRSSGVACAHVVQCDTEVVEDEIVDIENLAEHEIKGLGGGMYPAGMLRMAENVDVASVLVITDGFIEVPPAEQIPYDVLWCILCAGGDASFFTPGYGRVMGVPFDDLLPKGSE